MKTGEFGANRLFVAIGSIVAVLLVAAMLYVSAISNNEPQMSPVNAVNIIKAARNYTHDLRSLGKPIPANVPLESLVSLKYLNEQDAEPFNGLQATLYLIATNNSPKSVLMRVRMTDGSQTVLFADGSSQQIPATAKAP